MGCFCAKEKRDAKENLKKIYSKQEINDIFNPPEIPAVTDVVEAVSYVGNHLNNCVKLRTDVELGLIIEHDEFIKDKVYRTLRIGQRFTEITEKSTNIDLNMAEYSMNVSHYVQYLIDKKVIDDEFLESMQILITTSNEFRAKFSEINEGYSAINRDLKVIRNECIEKDKEIKKDIRNTGFDIDKHERERFGINAITTISGVTTVASYFIFPYAIPFLAGWFVSNLSESLNHPNDVDGLKNKVESLNRYLKQLEGFEVILNNILQVVVKFEIYWREHVERISALIRKTEYERVRHVKLSEVEGSLIVKKWKDLEGEFRDYHRRIFKELKNITI
ncbi:unnamed protein product [Rhizophagus irregularis]|uniref:Uncharacterized protein n=1 Tax=Rhizophagus irregularis TaxID=588596 RepID=A0A2I1HQM1_9GLOM|nr:hypothetical protein RhiirA4_485759 [Rhizophagus irregularis]CAB4403981.1 unnamed protein product [Rhizophagus irregularis]